MPPFFGKLPSPVAERFFEGNMRRAYHGIELDSERIADFCRQHAITQLSLFGSILRDDFRPNSDVDVRDVDVRSGLPFTIRMGSGSWC